jgi:hypothetical protein
MGHPLSDSKSLPRRYKDLVEKGAEKIDVDRRYRNKDIFTIYRNAPLRAKFLYAPRHKEVRLYLLQHTKWLHSLAGDSCAICINLAQLDGSEDECHFIRADIVKGVNSIRIPELPCLFFWDQRGEIEHISLSDNSDYPAGTYIHGIVETVFDVIRDKPEISSVTRVKELLEENRLKHGYHSKKSSDGAQPVMFVFNSSQIGAVGQNADARDMTFIQGNTIDLTRLAKEL